jgi:hypothetical protein
MSKEAATVTLIWYRITSMTSAVILEVSMGARCGPLGMDASGYAPTGSRQKMFLKISV